MMDGAMAALGRIGAPAYGHRFGAKGCLVFNPQPVGTTASSSPSTATHTPTG